jgi:hypothetical protein
MLFKSGVNLVSGVINFMIDNNSITLFSAYIKLNQLVELNTNKTINRIVIRWEIEDILKGVSDFEELYDYCKKNNIALFRNTRIHLKVIWNNENSLLFGSANVTGRGIGQKGDNFNYELSGIANSISFDDITYLNHIINQSELVDDDLFFKLKGIVDTIELPLLEFEEFPTEKKIADEFLLSQLPMTSSPQLLFEILQNPDTFPLEEQLKAAHDSALFSVNQDLDLEISMEVLEESFNQKQIIQRLKTAIIESERKSMSYGTVVRWIQENTTTVPTPMSWEIKKEQIVNNLYEWICFFDGQYSWDKPRHTQVIYYFKD